MTKEQTDKPGAEKGNAERQNREPPMNAREEWFEFLKTAFFAVLLALVIRTFLFEPFNIPSGSMKPTLKVGDYLFVYKPSYGFSRHSFPFGLAPIEGRVMAREVKRGDIVVFKLPRNTGVDYIKRVVALPGETVQVIDGRLYINGHIVPRRSLGWKRIKDGNLFTNMHEYIETLPGGLEHHIYEEGDHMPLDNTPKYVIPEGKYFLMGDNRDNSQDSRVMHHVGYVPYENIIGRAEIIFFSTNGYAGLFEFWNWPWTVRYDRLFNWIHDDRKQAAAGG
jgi:signal peptidase I